MTEQPAPHPRESSTTRYLRSTLAVGIGLGWLAAALVLLRGVFPDGPVPRALMCLAWLIFAPLYAGDVVRALRERRGLGELLAWSRPALEAAPLLLIPAPLFEAVLFGGSILALGHLFLARENARFSAVALASPPLIVVLALALAPSAALLVLLPATLVVASCGAVLLHGRVARERVRRGRRSEEAQAATLRRIGYGALLSLALLAAGLFVFVGTESGLRGLARANAPERRADRPLAPTPAPAAGGDRGSTPMGGEGFSPDMAFSGGTFPFGVAPVLKVRPRTDAPESAGPVHMRDMVLDHFHAGGVSLRERTSPPLHEDATDGTVDGWTHVLAPRPAEETREYTVLARPLTVAGVGWTLLFSPHPLVAIEYEPVLYHPDQVLATPDGPADWFEYGLRVERRGITGARLAAARATHPDPQYTQLPEGDPALDAIRAYARDLWPGSTTDFDKVLRVVRHLRDTFDYELSHTTFEGPAAIVEFLERRSGYCTYFASAATLMLRSEGIAARLATGFLAKEYSEEEAAWIAREKDAHAWMEVHFEGVGWVTFDATPVSGDSGMGGVGGLDDTSGAGPLQEMVDLFRRWSSGSNVGLGEVFLAALGWMTGLLRSPLAWVLLAVLAALFAFRRGGASGGGLLAAARGGPRREDVFARLEAALARHGYHRRPGETPREFAAAVSARGGELFAPVPRAAELLYGVRFGEAQLESEESRFLGELVKKLGATEVVRG